MPTDAKGLESIDVEVSLARLSKFHLASSSSYAVIYYNREDPKRRCIRLGHYANLDQLLSLYLNSQMA